MKKQNVIDLAAYRDELARETTQSTPPAKLSLTISDELKSAIESLIIKLRDTRKPE